MGLDFEVLDSDDSDSEQSDVDESDESDGDGDDSGNEADGEEAWDDEKLQPSFGLGMSVWARKVIQQMYSTCYEEPCNERISHPPAQMPHILDIFKAKRPNYFCKILRITPHTIDKLCKKIQHDPIFFNNSNNAQIPVEEQLAITLYCFGHNGKCGQPSISRSMGWHRKRVTSSSHQTCDDSNIVSVIYEQSGALTNSRGEEQS